MSVIPAFPEAVPIEMLKTAVLTASQKADWIDMIIGLLAEIPAEKRSELGPDVRFMCSVVNCIIILLLRHFTI